MTDGDVDRPDVVEEVTRCFERYEVALMANDLATLEVSVALLKETGLTP